MVYPPREVQEGKHIAIVSISMGDVGEGLGTWAQRDKGANNVVQGTSVYHAKIQISESSRVVNRRCRQGMAVSLTKYVGVLVGHKSPTSYPGAYGGDKVTEPLRRPLGPCVLTSPVMRWYR